MIRQEDRSISLKSQDRTPGRGIYWGWFVVAGSFLILAMNYGSRYCFGVFIKPMFSEYGWTMALLSLGASLNLFMYAAGGILSGSLLDRLAPRWIMTIGAVLTGAGFILTGFLRSPLELYLYYGVLCGLGSAGIGVVVSSSSVGKWFERKKGLAVGITTTGIGFGTLALTPLAGYMVGHFGWRMGFVLLGGLIAIIGVTLSQFFMGKRTPEDHGWLPDGLPLAMDVGSRPADRPAGKNGLLSQRAFRTVPFWVMVLCFSIAVMAEMTAFVHQVSYGESLGIDRIIAASSIGVIGLTSIFGRFFYGWLSDRLKDPKYSASLGFLVMALGMILLIRVKGPSDLLVYAAVFGFGYGSLAPMMPILLSDRFGRQILGSTYGFLTFFVVGIGGSIGPLLGGWLFDRFGTYAYGWAVNLALLFAAAVLMLFLQKVSEAGR